MAITKNSQIDLNGNEMILDADGDTTITADTDVQIDFKTAGTDRVQINSTGDFLVRQTSADVYDTNSGSSVRQFWGNQFSAQNNTNSRVIIGSASNKGLVGGATVNASSKPIVNSYMAFESVDQTAGGEDGVIAFYTSSGGGSGTEKMRIISDGKVGIATTTPLYELDVNGESHIRTRLFVGDGSASSPSIRFYNASTGLYYPGSDGLGFVSSGTEYMRLTLNGDFAIGSVTLNSNNVADASSGNGFCYSANATRDFLAVTRDSGVVAYFNRIGNGDVLAIRKNGSTKGTISVNDSTVSYNPFMGSHYSETSDSEILLGTVMEYTGELVENYNVEEKRLSKVKISDTSESTKVYGIYFANGDESGGDLIAGLGASWCRINKDVTVQLGDLLVSNGDGTAKVQSDDIIRSKTIGKVTSTTVKETYSDGSYVVPVVLYCG